MMMGSRESHPAEVVMPPAMAAGLGTPGKNKCRNMHLHSTTNKHPIPDTHRPRPRNHNKFATEDKLAILRIQSFWSKRTPNTKYKWDAHCTKPRLSNATESARRAPKVSATWRVASKLSVSCYRRRTGRGSLEPPRLISGSLRSLQPTRLSNPTHQWPLESSQSQHSQRFW
jgi:hypothetical protein